MGGGAFEGNMAYGAADLGMSVYGIGRLVLKPDSWRLFRYVRTDYIRAHKNASMPALILDRGADAMTADGMREQWRNNK